MVANQTRSGSEDTENKIFYSQTSKDPGLKTQGFLFLHKEKMTDTRLKQQAEYVRQHTLTESDLRKMIAEKLERARAWHNAQLRREALRERR